MSALPPPRTPLVGRDAEREALLAALAAPGLVTLHGPGGVGKTRLLRELGEVPAALLAGITDPDLLVAAVAATVGSAPEPAAIGRALAHRGTPVLALDNLEQLGADAGRFVSTVLAHAPRLTVVATSRTRLEVEGERVIPIVPLAVADGVALLRDRLARRAPGRRFDDAELAALVTALDALPLALELAAARIPALGASGVLAQLGRRLELLVDGGPDRPAHHRSLRDTVRGSWDLLAPAEREALRRLSLLPDRFVLDDLAGQGDPDLPLRVAALVDAALLRADDGSPVVYQQYEGVRAFVRETIPPDDPLRAEVTAGLCAVAEQATAALSGPRVAEAIATLLSVRPALMDAADEALRAGRLEDFGRAVLALDRVLHQHGPGGWREQRLRTVAERLPATHPHRVEAVLSLVMTGGDAGDDAVLSLPDEVVPPALRARRDVARAKRAFDRGDLPLATALAAEAAAKIPPSDTRVFLGACWIRAGIHAASGRLDEARAAYSEGLRVARDHRSPLDEALFLGQLGSVLLDAGDDDAPRALAAAVAILERHADFRRSIWVLRLAELEVDAGRAAEGLDRADAALEIMRSTGQLRFEGYALGVRARALEALGRVPEALDTWERARDRGGHPMLGATIEAWYGRALADAGHLDAARAAIGRATTVIPADAKLAPLPALCGAHVALALARRAEAEGRDPEPDRAEAQATAARTTPLAHEVRAARQRLLEALARDRGPDGVVTAADGSWLQLGGVRTDLSTRHAIRRVWVALVDAHPTGAVLGVDALFAAGWPGEKAHPDAARERVYHAIGTLRRSGLAAVLERVEGGWRLRPAFPVRRG